jgi:tetratricopeptide (TPR) repeat protein
VGVFTEVMAAKIDGNPVEDLKGFKDETGDAFANDVSRNFEDLCAEHPSFNSLRGLQELVAVSKALEELEQRPDLLYWLDKYPLLGNQTPKETKVLYRKYNGQRGICEVSGGVHLTALAMRLNAGDVTALREAVLKVRPSSNDLSWTFLSAEWLIPIGSGQVKTEDIVPLFSQAVFLDEHARYEQAIALLDEIIKVKPDYAEPWYRKGKALGKLGKVDDAIKCYDAAIECYNKILQVNPRLAEAYYRRGRAYCEIDMYGQAMADFGKAIEFNPSLSEMFKEQGIACGLLVWADNTPVTAGRVKIVDKIDVYRSGLGGFAVQQIGISRDAKVWDSTIGRNGYYSCRSLPEGKYYLFFNIPDAYIDRSKFHSYDKNWFYIREPEPSGIMVYHIAGHMYKPDEFNVKGSPVCVIPTIELTRRLDLIAPLQVGMKDGVYRFAWQKSNKAGSSRIIIEHMVYDNIQHPVYKEHELVGYSYLIPDETPLYPGRHRFRVQMITPTLRVYADSGWQEFVVPGKVLGLWIEEDKTDPTRRTIKWSGSEEIKSVRISSDDGSLIMTSADQSVRLPIVREERRLQFQSLGADGKEMVPGWKKWFQQPITVENQIK